MNTEKREFINKMMGEAKAYCEKNLDEKATVSLSLSERAGNGEMDYYSVTAIVYDGPILNASKSDCFSVSFYNDDTPYDTLGKALDFIQRLRTSVEALKKQAEPMPVVSIHKTGDEVDGVRVCVGDEDFVIALHDEINPKDTFGYRWEDAANTFDLPTIRQAHLIAAYIDEVQEKLVEAGGDQFSEAGYWTKSKFDNVLSWMFNCGLVVVNDGTIKYGVRPVRSIKA